MDRVMSESCYKGTILQWKYIEKEPFILRKTTIHFTRIPLQNVMVKKFGKHNLTVLYSNLCYNEVCYNECKLLATAQTSLHTCTVWPDCSHVHR